MIMKLRNQPHAPKWEREERKKMSRRVVLEIGTNCSTETAASIFRENEEVQQFSLKRW
jgi:hypothetical protein